jgi:hypothetical protein
MLPSRRTLTATAARALIALVVLVTTAQRVQALSVEDVSAYYQEKMKDDPPLKAFWSTLLEDEAKARDHAKETASHLYDPASPRFPAIVDKLYRIGQIVASVALTGKVIADDAELDRLWRDADLTPGTRQLVGMLVYARTQDPAVAAETLSAAPGWFVLFTRAKDPKAQEIARLYLSRAYAEFLTNTASKPYCAQLIDQYPEVIRMASFQEFPPDLTWEFVTLFPKMRVVEDGKRPHTLDPVTVASGLRGTDLLDRFLIRLVSENQMAEVQSLVRAKVTTEDHVRELVQATLKNRMGHIAPAEK